MKRLRCLLAVAIALAAASCSVARIAHRPPVLLGGDWPAALPKVQAWASSSSIRSFQLQDLDADSMRIFPALDSLVIADAWRRAGLDHPMLRHLPPAPAKAGILCRENYIFYLRGNRIVGVEYRAVESDGWGGHRQADETIGEISASPPGSS
jgi:hypothetical protein